MATAAITGTATAAINEVDIRAGGKTVIITLTGDTWVASGGTFNAQRQAIINGLNSAQSELTGWNNEVRDNLGVGDVTRNSDTQVTVDLSGQVTYDISAQETITVTVPASALVSGILITATPTFTVDTVAFTAAITGTATAAMTEADVVAGLETILITLTGGIWVASGGVFNGQRQAIIDGLTSAQSEATGWNLAVRANLLTGDVVRTSDTLVTITLSAQATYDITAQETIEVTVPATALVPGGSSIVGTPTFTVDTVPLVVVTGTVTPKATESEIVAGFHVEYAGPTFAIFFLAEYRQFDIGTVKSGPFSWAVRPFRAPFGYYRRGENFCQFVLCACLETEVFLICIRTWEKSS